MNLIDDCERFVLRSFDGVKQSAMHIYHSTLSWAPTSSPTRQLYERELMTETKQVNEVSPTWDACIRFIPVGKTVEAVMFSPSGILIAARGECWVTVFDAMTGVNRATFDGQELIFSVSFSPDDGFLVSGHSCGTIKVWDIQTGTMFRTFQGSMWSFTYSVTFSSCGTMVASGGSDRTVRIWNIESGSCDCAFQGHSGAVKDVCWLATWNQVVSASYDLTVRVWDVQKQTCLKIFAQFSDPVAALASTRDLLLVAYTNDTVKIYDSQSGDIIHVIMFNGLINSRISIDGGKVLLAGRYSGDIWDITTKTLTCVGSINNIGYRAIFSPDGTHIASIYGKFLKILKANAGYSCEAHTHVYDPVYISPDERLITLKSKTGANIVDVTTGQTLFACPVTNILSIVFSLDSAFIAFLLPHGIVQTWNAHTCLQKYINVQYDALQIALCPDGSQLASLSPFDMELWDLKSEGCLAHLEFDDPLKEQVQISFSTDATSVSVLKHNGTQSWRIHTSHNSTWFSQTKNGDATKLPKVFVPTMKEQSNLYASMPCQSYRCYKDGEWILDLDGRRILWIPPDERPRMIWNCFKHEKKVLMQTESGKVYIVNFS